MYFFKYQKPENLEFNMLRHGEVYFASVSELNDANECRPRFILNGTQELWKRLAHFILAKVCFSSNYSDYSERATPEEIRKILDLSVSIGRLLKEQVKNQDIGIENLGRLFTDALKPLLEQKFSALQSRLILKLSHNFIERNLLRFGEDDPSPEFVFFQAKQVLDRFDFEIQPVGILEDRYSEHHLSIKLVQDLDEVTVERLRGMSERIKSKRSDSN
jgi:hypothetical protein